MKNGMMNIMTVEPAYATATLFTAQDPELVKRLHEQAKRDTREMKLLSGPEAHRVHTQMHP